MSFSVEKAGNQSTPAIQEIYDEAIQHAHSVGMIDWPLPFPEVLIDEYCRDKEMFVLRTDSPESDIVAAFKLTETPNMKIWDDSTKALYIGKIAVGDRARGMNMFYGEILPNVCQIATSSSIAEIRLDCLANNERLQNFYARCFEHRGNSMLTSRSGDRIEVARFSLQV